MPIIDTMDEFGVVTSKIVPAEEMPEAELKPKEEKESLSIKKKAEKTFEKYIQEPLCAISNIIYKFDKIKGWIDYSNELKRLCLNDWSTQGENVFKWFKVNFQLKNFDSEDFAVYHQWLMPDNDYYNGSWERYELTTEQMLFANGILNLRDWSFEEFRDGKGIHQKIIFGCDSDIFFNDSYREFLVSLRDNGFSVLNSAVQDLISFIFNGHSIEYTWNLFEKVSCILMPHNHVKSEFYFYGKANTLKTTFAKALCYAIAGKRGISEATQEELVRDKWAIVNLVNKFVNLSDDSPSARKWIPFMKSITGKGSFILERKNCDPVSVPLTCKFINCTNELPHSEEGQAVKNRIEIFEFTNVITRSNSIDQDKYLTAQYWQQIDRRKSMLAMLLVAAHRLINRGEYMVVQDYTEKREELLNEIDPIQDILESCLEESEGSFVTSVDIAKFCFNAENDRQLQMKINSYIKDMFPTAQKVKIRKNRREVRGFINVKMTFEKKDFLEE